MIFMVGLTDFMFTAENNDPYEKKIKQVREQMIQDICKSVELAREKGEIFTFAELVASSGKTIWYGEAERKLMCAEALFRLLDDKDYRFGKKELFFESIAKELENGSGLWLNKKPSAYSVRRLTEMNER